jgi:iron(III) transport system ATP-binding protein
MTTGIHVRGLVKIYGANRVIDDVSFDVAPGEFVTLLGPSGCGKTTTLRAIAGLEPPDGGVIDIGGVVVSDPAHGVFVPAHARDVGMVFQSYAIWPHLSVAENVGFPLQVRKRRDPDAVRWALDVVGMSHLAERRPAELSGGQQQRVALARAIVGHPKLLLFDEPLSNLDARLRDRTRAEISRIQRELGAATIYVTHDQAEALSMSDRVVLMNAGTIAQSGAPRDLYRRPVSRFVADFVGQANFLPVRQQGDAWLAGDGTVLTVTPDPARAGQALLLVRPEAIRLMSDAACDNRLQGVVQSVAYMGPYLDCIVAAAGTQLRVAISREVAPGDTVVLGFDAADCRLLPVEA